MNENEIIQTRPPLRESDTFFVLKVIRDIFKKYQPEVKMLLKADCPDDVIQVYFRYFHSEERFNFFMEGSGPALKLGPSNARAINCSVGRLDTSKKRKFFEKELLKIFRKKLQGLKAEKRIIRIVKKVIRESDFTLETGVDYDNLGIDIFLRYKDSPKGIALQVKRSHRFLKELHEPSEKQQRYNRRLEEYENNFIHTLIVGKKSDRQIRRYIEHLIESFIKLYKNQI